MSSLLLQNEKIGLRFQLRSMQLTEVQNHLSGEVYPVDDQSGSLATSKGQASWYGQQCADHEVTNDSIKAVWQIDGYEIIQRWQLRPGDAYATTCVTVTPRDAVELLHVSPHGWGFDAQQVAIDCYQHLKSRTFFARTDAGGFFAGLQMAFDDASAEAGLLQLGHSVNLPIKARASFACESAYIGVYQSQADDESVDGMPRRAELAAMRILVEDFLGPPTHCVVSVAVGWHSEMTRMAYTDEDLEADINALQVIADCGIDMVMDSHPFAGQHEQLATLTDANALTLDKGTKRFLDRAAKLGIDVGLWTTMNHAHPWRRDDAKPLRSDREDWMMWPEGMLHEVTYENGHTETIRNVPVTCIANAPYFDWLVELNRKYFELGKYTGWSVDGHFIGLPYGGRLIVPAECPSDQHDHLPGDANLACMRRQTQLIEAIRAINPDVFIQLLRPAMDMGVWSMRGADGIYTVHESAELTPLPGLDDTEPHKILGDKIRNWSRVRTDEHFLPHHMDMSLLFPSPISEGYKQSREWSGEFLEYTLLSALSSSPKMYMNVPTRSGLPESDRVMIRYWLDWARDNEKYLMQRVDLFGRPGADKVDGTAHIVDGEGFVFLFNPGRESRSVDSDLSACGLANDATACVVNREPDGQVQLQGDGSLQGQLRPRSAVLVSITA